MIAILSLWLNLSLRGRDKLFLGCIHRSPSSTTGSDYNLWNMLKLITKTKPSHLLIAGDLNYPDINWDTVGSVKHSQNTWQKFIDAVRDSFLHQHVTQPTRYRHEQNPSTLNNVLTSEVNIIKHINYPQVLGLTDHVCIFYLKLNVTKPEQYVPIFCYHKGDYVCINNYLLEINLANALHGKTVEDVWK